MRHPSDGYKAILFDLDGTLLEVKERFFFAFNQTLASFGKTPLDWGAFLEDFSKDTLTRHLPEEYESQRNFLFTLLENFSKARDAVPVRPIPGAREALEILAARGYRMSVVTGRSARPESIREELDEIGSFECLDHIFSHPDGYRPDGGEAMSVLSKEPLIQRAADRMGVPVGSCVFVGDWTGDIRSARGAGVGFIVAVLSGGMDEEVLRQEGPHLVISSVADLPSCLP